MSEKPTDPEPTNDASKPAEGSAVLPDGTKLPPYSDEKWEKFERELPRNYRDRKGD